MSEKIIGVFLCLPMAAFFLGCDEAGNLLNETEEGDLQQMADCDSVEHPPPPPPRRPPPEAYEACAGSKTGDSCSVEIHGRTVDGECHTGPRGEDEIHCRPPHPPRHHRRLGPPPEAFAACEELEEGTACEVEFRGDALAGKCVTGPREDSRLACAPDDPPPPPPRHRSVRSAE